ncbi:hypothetical protein [Pedobacter sp. KLB.chiD]
MDSKIMGGAKDKTILNEEFWMQTLNNMIAEMLINGLKSPYQFTFLIRR